MNHENYEMKYRGTNIFGVIAGMFVGVVAGAVTMLLLAPQSGVDTRIQIQKKGVQLRDQTSKMIEDTMAQVRSSANKISVGGREKADELLQRGQTLVVEQLDHISEAALAGKKVIKGS